MAYLSCKIRGHCPLWSAPFCPRSELRRKESQEVSDVMTEGRKKRLKKCTDWRPAWIPALIQDHNRMERESSSSSMYDGVWSLTPPSDETASLLRKVKYSKVKFSNWFPQLFKPQIKYMSYLSNKTWYLWALFLSQTQQEVSLSWIVSDRCFINSKDALLLVLIITWYQPSSMLSQKGLSRSLIYNRNRLFRVCEYNVIVVLNVDLLKTHDWTGLFRLTPCLSLDAFRSGGSCLVFNRFTPSLDQKEKKADEEIKVCPTHFGSLRVTFPRLGVTRVSLKTLAWAADNL